MKTIKRLLLLAVIGAVVLNLTGYAPKEPATKVKSVIEDIAKIRQQGAEKMLFSYEEDGEPTKTSGISSSLDVYFINVGQGDSTLITAGDGHGILIDTGAKTGHVQVDKILEWVNVETIDMLILTHPDADHIQNADEILSDYSVLNVVMPNAENDTASFDDLKDAIEESNVNVVIPDGKMTVPVGDGKLEIYSAPGEYEDINSYSLITKLYKGDKTFLFLGDATGEEIADLAAKKVDFSADVVKAAHHGSANCGCNSPELFDEIAPQSVVISCGYGNDYGHPHRETMEYLKEHAEIDVFRTDIQGTIYVRCADGCMKWSVNPTDNYTGGSDM